MDDEHRNWALAIVVSFAILIVYQLFFSESPRTPNPTTQTQDQRAPE